MLQALAAEGNMFHGSGKLFKIGAFVFIISDTLLALNKFYKPFEMGDVSVMLTYGIAQLLIVSAAIKNEDRKPNFAAPQKLKLS